MYLDGCILGQTEDFKKPQHKKKAIEKYKESMLTIIANSQEIQAMSSVNWLFVISRRKEVIMTF